MSSQVANKFGLCLTHNRIKVILPDPLLEFYKDKFGMKYLSKAVNESTNEQSHFLGFSGNEGERYNKQVTFFEFVQPIKEEAGTKGKTVNFNSKDSVYWKIGVNMPDIDKAAEKLRKKGVSVSDPNQFRDIGYLCHLSDPYAYSIELLQFYFKDRKQPYEAKPDHSLGQQPVFGMVTLRVKDIEASLRFYRDTLGMKLLCREDVSVFGFHLYFLAFTTDEPPNPDINAEENREWTYQRPFTVIELQASINPPEGLHYKEVEPGYYGFLGLGMGTEDIEGLKSHLEEHHNQLVTAIEQDKYIFNTKTLTTTDPDGIPIRFIEC